MCEWVGLVTCSKVFVSARWCEMKPVPSWNPSHITSLLASECTLGEGEVRGRCEGEVRGRGGRERWGEVMGRGKR